MSDTAQSQSESSQSGVEIECPECGHSEVAQIGPTLAIGADFDVNITNVNCGKCGYEGNPLGKTVDMVKEEARSRAEKSDARRKGPTEDNWTGSYLVRHVGGREMQAVEYLKDHTGIVYESAPGFRYLCIHGWDEAIEDLTNHELFESVEKEGYSRTMESDTDE